MLTPRTFLFLLLALCYILNIKSSYQTEAISWNSTLIQFTRNLDRQSSRRLLSHLQDDLYLSVVLVMRNDDYGGNLLERFLISISEFSSLALIHQLRTELIVVEWNPPRDRRRIFDAVDWPTALQNLTIVTVNSQAHENIGCRGWEYEGKNLGISLARGQYILSSNSDIVLSDSLVKYLAQKHLREDCFYRPNRHDVIDPASLGRLANTSAELALLFEIHSIRRLHRWGLEWHPLPDGPTPQIEGRESLDAYREANLPPWPDGEPVRRLGLLHHTAAGDFMLMHAGRWRALGGFARDSYCGSYCDNHTDSYLAAAAAAHGLRQVRLPPPLVVYHQEHYRTRQRDDCPPNNWARFTAAAARMLATGEWRLGGHGPARTLDPAAYTQFRRSPLADALSAAASGPRRALAAAILRGMGSPPPAVDPARACAGRTAGMRPERRAGLYALIGNRLAWAGGPGLPGAAADAGRAARACYVAALAALDGAASQPAAAARALRRTLDAARVAWPPPPPPPPPSPPLEVCTAGAGEPGPGGARGGGFESALRAAHVLTSAGLAAAGRDDGGAREEALFWMERAARLAAAAAAS
jgi:hypothetical protein